MNTSPFYYERVTDPAELQRYISNYLRLSGNELPLDYLKKAIVFQFYQGPKPVAGFVLNTHEKYPLRYLSYLDKEVRRQVMTDENLREKQFLEITANWKLPELRARYSRIYYTVMLSQAYKHARLLKKHYLMGGSIIKAVKIIQQELMNRVIYHGPISTEHLTTVRERTKLLKIYIIELDNVPVRATAIILEKYIVRAFKNRLKRILLYWRKRFSVPVLLDKEQIPGS